MWLKLISVAQSEYPFPIVLTPAMEEGAGLPVSSCLFEYGGLPLVDTKSGTEQHGILALVGE